MLPDWLPSDTEPRVTLVAHRGASALAPENSLDAIELAARYRMDFAEIDVRASREHELLLVHDEHIAAPHRGTRRRVADMDAAALRELDARGAGPARLRDALATAARCGIGLYVELKDARAVRPLSAMLGAMAAAERPELIVGSFQPQIVADLRDLLPEVTRSVLFGPATVNEILATCRATRARFAHPCARPVDSATVAVLHRAGLAVMAPHTNHLAEARSFRACGIDVIASDDPRLLRALVDE